MTPEQREALAVAVLHVNRIVALIARSDEGRTRLRGWCNTSEESDGFVLQVDISTGRETIR